MGGMVKGRLRRELTAGAYDGSLRRELKTELTADGMEWLGVSGIGGGDGGVCGHLGACLMIQSSAFWMRPRWWSMTSTA